MPSLVRMRIRSRTEPEPKISSYHIESNYIDPNRQIFSYPIESKYVRPEGSGSNRSNLNPRI